MKPEREMICFCFCGPTASGKTSLSRRLVEQSTDLRLSISTTTRAPRQGETDGKEYHFVSKAEFEKRIAAGAFIEHATFNTEHYGTEKRNIDDAIKGGYDVVLDIEVQGVGQLKKLFGPRVVTVFVFPSSMDELEKRLRERGTEDENKIQARLKIAQGEVQTLRSPGFSDYLLVNDKLESALERAQQIVAAERIRFSRVEGYVF